MNSALLKIEKKKNEYLDKYIQSLKNIVINLSNPNNFNFWLKISNIILKNIFVALKIKGFSLDQNLDQKIYSKLESYRSKIDEKKRVEYDKKCDNYKTKMSKMKDRSKTKDISPSADSERSYNLITISQKGKDDIKSSLSIDFLFYLKEKGNQFNHFDEKVLDFIIFNELNIIDEENEIIIQADQTKEINIENANEIIIEENNVKDIKDENASEKINKEVKSEKVKDEKGKANVLEIQGNQKKEKKDEINNINVEGMKLNESNNKINDTQVKEEKYENNLDKKSPEDLKIEKITAEEMNLNRKYEGKRIFTEDELINMLKNPLKFNRNNYKKMNFLEEIYNMTDELKKDLVYDDSMKQLSELERKAKGLDIKCKELLLTIEKYFLNNNIDNKNIEEIIKNENTNQETKIKGMIYLELLKLEKNIQEKLKNYKVVNDKILNLNNLVTDKEKKVNKYIDEIQKEIETASNLIKLSDIFNQYKIELRKKMETENEYKEHQNIFNKKNEEEFVIDDLFKFIKDCLNNNSFLLAKRDIINYNFYVEVIMEFNELNFLYEKDVDLDLNAKEAVSDENSDTSL